MNERIQELKRQASIWCDQNIPGEFDEITGGYGYHWEEKFAELIVRECMSIIKQNENASLNVGNFTDEKKQGIQLGLEFAITDIAEHFGVEE